MKKTLAASALMAGLVVMGTASPALADPAVPAALNGSGSDTTELIMTALDDKIDALGSWSVTGTTPYDTNGADPGCSFNGRILGSTAGRTALANSVSNGDGCWEFARSSSRSTGQAPGSVAGGYTGTGSSVVPMLPLTLGIDGLTYVFRAGASTPRDLTLGQLRTIYNCTFTGIVDGRSMSSPTIPNKPLIPTDQSGSRADWLAFMNLPTSPTGSGASEVASDGGTLPACIEDGPGDAPGPGGEYAEHNGNVLTASRQIILHSIPQYLAQGTGLVPDSRGLSVLGFINGNNPLALFDNPAGVLNNATVNGSTIVDGALFRPVFNIVPASQVSDPAVEAVFGVRGGGSSSSGSDIPNSNSGAICLEDALISNYGFTPVC